MNSSNLLTLEKFNNLNSILTKVTIKNQEKYQTKKTQVLDVIFSVKDSNIDTIKITNYRISIEGLEAINKYNEAIKINDEYMLNSEKKKKNPRNKCFSLVFPLFW